MNGCQRSTVRANLSRVMRSLRVDLKSLFHKTNCESLFVEKSGVPTCNSTEGGLESWRTCEAVGIKKANGGTALDVAKY